MKKSKKTIQRLILALVVLAAGYLYMNMGGLITRTAEKIASDALGVAVNIGSIDVSLSDKKVTVSSIKIANPPGYRNAYAMTAESILIGLNTASSELIDFKDIQVKGSVVNLEITEKGINLNDLKSLASRKEQQESTGSKQIEVIIRHMVIDASVINPSISLVDRDIGQIKMPAISFSNMGKGSGMEAGDAIAQVMSKYLTAIVQEARGQGVMNGLPGMGDVQKTLDDAAGSLKKLFQ